jgi:hypothetical protein
MARREFAALAPAQPFSDLHHLRIDFGMALAALALAGHEPLALACGLYKSLAPGLVGRQLDRCVSRKSLYHSGEYGALRRISYVPLDHNPTVDDIRNKYCP